MRNFQVFHVPWKVPNSSNNLSLSLFFPLSLSFSLQSLKGDTPGSVSPDVREWNEQDPALKRETYKGFSACANRYPFIKYNPSLAAGFQVQAQSLDPRWGNHQPPREERGLFWWLKSSGKNKMRRAPWSGEGKRVEDKTINSEVPCPRSASIIQQVELARPHLRFFLQFRHLLSQLCTNPANNYAPSTQSKKGKPAA